MSPAARWLPISPAAGAADRQYPLATIATPCNQPDLSGSGPCTPLPLPLISRQTGSLHPFGGFGLRKTVAPRSNEDRSFEVIAHTCVTLTIRPSGFGWAGRSHSLWFCDAQQPGVFRWYETAFMIPFGGTSRNGLVPFDMVPGDPNAIQALAPVTHSHQVAWPFTPIDQGDEESFIERWMEWFAKAAQGQLRRPSTMPESNPQGSWRR